MSAISLQWALNETANNTFTIAKGFIKAASSDNIQALALIACEAFGSTLAMSQETCMKVERVAGLHHQSVFVNFLKAQIGYSSGDSAAQLSLSAAGVRFMGLAAALVTLGAFKGAAALESMMAETASERQLLPTVSHLRDLLNVLEYKLVRTGFAESAAGWGIWFNSNSLLSDGHKILVSMQTAPQQQELTELIKALREIGRLGDAIQVTVTVMRSAAWVTAFIKWSLGMPPSIISDHGTTLLEQPESNITLVVGRAQGMTVAISRHMNSPAEIVEMNTVAERKSSWTGMVSVQTYAKTRFQRLGLHSDLAKRAVVQALPYAVKQVTDLLQPTDLSEYDSGIMPAWKETQERKHVYNPDIRGNLPFELVCLAGNMFPSDAFLSSALSEFTGIEVHPPLPSLPEGILVSDLPLVKMYREALRRECKCVDCDEARLSQYRVCIKDNWLSNISSLVADILAFSLLDLTEPALLYIKAHLQPQQVTLFERSVRCILAEGKPTPCYVEAVIDFVLNLVGHDVSALKEENWIMSSYRGQSLFPRLFETETLERQGLLVMSGAPGALRYNDQTYNRVMAAREEFRIQLGEPGGHVSRLKIPVERPLNLLQKEYIKWEVTTGDRSLYISLLSTCATATFNPFAVLCAAVQSLYVEHCPHTPDAALINPDPFAAYTSPYNPWELPDLVGVVAVHGNEGLRMFSFVRGIPGVVQKNACLQCSLDVCRRAGYRFVIDGGNSDIVGTTFD